MQLSDDHVQALLEAIQITGNAYAIAKAETKRCEEARKMTKSALMKNARLFGEGVRSREMAEAEAYTHPQYKHTSDRLVAAIKDEVEKEVAFKNAEREWESWRTLCANERSVR